MPTKVLLLTGSVAAGATWTQIASVTVPAGERWTVSEVRIATTDDSVGVRLIIRIGATFDTIVNTTGKISNLFKLPLPVSFVVDAGGTIAVESNNPTASTQTVHVEIVYSTGT